MQTDKELIANLNGPHEWGYRDPVEGGFIEDLAPFRAADRLEALSSPMPSREEVVSLLRKNLDLTCGRNCEREMGQADEDAAYAETANELLSLFSSSLGGGKEEKGIPESPGVSAVQSPASPAARHSDGTPMPADFVDEVRARLMMIADGEHLRGKTTHFIGELRSLDHIVRVAALNFGRPEAQADVQHSDGGRS